MRLIWARAHEENTRLIKATSTTAAPLGVSVPAAGSHSLRRSPPADDGAVTSSCGFNSSTLTRNREICTRLRNQNRRSEAAAGKACKMGKAPRFD